MDFMERMDVGRAVRKRELERHGSTSCTVVTTAEYYRRRGAGHDDRTDVPYWEPPQSEDDYMTEENDVGSGVDAPDPGERGAERETRRPAKRTLSRGQIMSAKKYVAALADLGLTPHTAAPVLGISSRMSYRYAAGTHVIPLTVAKLIRALVALGRIDP
jgi:hypothetical protein